MKKLIFILMIALTTICQAQNPTPFTAGIKPQRIVPIPLTTTQIAALPTQPTGTIVYNSTLGLWQYYDGDSWELFGSSGTPTLEDVLAAGNSTLNAIHLNGTGGNMQIRGEDVQIQSGNNYGTFGANQIDFSSSTDPWSSYLSLSALNFTNISSSISAEYGKNGISLQDNTLSNFTVLDRVDQYLNFYNTPDATETSYTKNSITYSNSTNSRRSQFNFNNFYLRFNDDDLGGQIEIKTPLSLNNSNEYIFPDSSTSTGISYIPISVNGEFADANGNIDLPSVGTSDLNTTTLAGNFTEQNIEFQAGAGLDFFDGTYTMNVMNNTMSANQNLGFPNTSGTLLAKVNGEASDSNGNVQVSLNDITTVGASSTVPITVENISTGNNTIIYDGYLTTSEFSSGKISYLTPNILSYQRGANYYNIIPPATLTTTRNIDLPDASGTVALISDLNNYLAIDGSNATAEVNINSNDFRGRQIIADNGSRSVYLGNEVIGSEGGLYSGNSDEIIAVHEPISNYYSYANGKIVQNEGDDVLSINSTKTMTNLFRSETGTFDELQNYSLFDISDYSLYFKGVSGTDFDGFGKVDFTISPEEGINLLISNILSDVSNSISNNTFQSLHGIYAPDNTGINSVNVTNSTDNTYLQVSHSAASYDIFYDDFVYFRINNPNKSVTLGDSIGAYNGTNISLNDNDQRIILNASDKIFINGGDEVSVTANQMTFNGLPVVTNKLTSYTTAEILSIGTPTAGEMYYNTTLNTIVFYNGTSWQKVTTTAM